MSDKFQGKCQTNSEEVSKVTEHQHCLGAFANVKKHNRKLEL